MYTERKPSHLEKQTMKQKIKQFLQTNKIEKLGIILSLTIFILAHGYNMFHFPYYENDEGTYMSQAWSLLKTGQLAPYTYWYDHAPAGWILIAAWVKLTGGFFTFGTSVNSGRLLILILNTLTCFFILRISKKLTGSSWGAIIGTIFFTLSPLELYFGRRVLLDNIMIFWVFLALWIITNTKLKLRHIILSSIAFGIAVLSKENAVFFIPAFLYQISSQYHKKQKLQVLIYWITIAFSIISLYFLYAYLKSELFPPGILGSKGDHVSLIQTLQYQVSRGSNLPFWNKSSDFSYALNEWLQKDPWIIQIGITTTIINMLFALRVKALRTPTILAACMWLFLIRGKLIIDFYVLPLIPIIALNIGILIETYAQTIKNNIPHKTTKKIMYCLTLLCFLIPIIIIYAKSDQSQYQRDETKSQTEAITWMKANLSTNQKIIIDGYAYVDLHDGNKIFKDADWFWKFSSDPAIKDQKYNKDWKNVNYIMLSHEMLKQIKDGTQDLLKKALKNSIAINQWSQNTTAFIDVKNYISTNGDWMAMYKVESRDQIILDESWKFFKDNFLKSYGQILDPQTQTTTSDMQAETMLRAVLVGDKVTYDGLLSWSKDHLQYRQKDQLFSMQWTGNDKTGHLADYQTSTKADEDIALSLLLAYKQWEDPNYLNQAQKLLNDIWKEEIIQINGQYYVKAGAEAETPDAYICNPSALTPAAYRIFAVINPTHPWQQVSDNTYTVLNKFSTIPETALLINKKTGELTPARGEKDAKKFTVSTTQTLINLARDEQWFKKQTAQQYIKKQTLSDDQAASLIELTITDKTKADTLFKTTIDKSFNYDEGYWPNKTNYENQTQTWFAVATYFNHLPNL